MTPDRREWTFPLPPVAVQWHNQEKVNYTQAEACMNAVGVLERRKRESGDNMAGYIPLSLGKGVRAPPPPRSVLQR